MECWKTNVDDYICIFNIPSITTVGFFLRSLRLSLFCGLACLLRQPRILRDARNAAVLLTCAITTVSLQPLPSPADRYCGALFLDHVDSTLTIFELVAYTHAYILEFPPARSSSEKLFLEFTFFLEFTSTRYNSRGSEREYEIVLLLQTPLGTARPHHLQPLNATLAVPFAEKACWSTRLVEP